MFRNSDEYSYESFLISEAEFESFQRDPLVYYSYGKIEKIDLQNLNKSSLHLFKTFAKSYMGKVIEKNTNYYAAEGFQAQFSHNILVRKHPYKNKVSYDVVEDNALIKNILVTIAIEDDAIKVKDTSKYLIKNTYLKPKGRKEMENGARMSPYYLAYENPVVGIGSRIKRIQGLKGSSFLTNNINRSFKNTDFIKMSRNALYALRLVHGLDILHNDLHAGNIIINPVTLSTTIIDFDDSSFLSEEEPYDTVMKTRDLLDIIEFIQTAFLIKFPEFNRLSPEEYQEALNSKQNDGSLNQLDAQFCKAMFQLFDSYDTLDDLTSDDIVKLIIEDDAETLLLINAKMDKIDITIEDAIRNFERIIFSYTGEICEHQETSERKMALNVALDLMKDFSNYSKRRLSDLTDLNSLIANIKTRLSSLSDKEFRYLHEYANNLIPDIQRFSNKDELATYCEHISLEYQAAYTKLQQRLASNTRSEFLLRQVRTYPITFDAMISITGKINKFLAYTEKLEAQVPANVRDPLARVSDNITTLYSGASNKRASNSTPANADPECRETNVKRLKT